MRILAETPGNWTPAGNVPSREWGAVGTTHRVAGIGALRLATSIKGQAGSPSTGRPLTASVPRRMPIGIVTLRASSESKSQG
jgi:hypothetical protein